MAMTFRPGDLMYCTCEINGSVCMDAHGVNKTLGLESGGSYILRIRRLMMSP
jgi:hypothetical protein